MHREGELEPRGTTPGRLVGRSPAAGGGAVMTPEGRGAADVVISGRGLEDGGKQKW